MLWCSLVTTGNIGEAACISQEQVQTRCSHVPAACLLLFGGHDDADGKQANRPLSLPSQLLICARYASIRHSSYLCCLAPAFRSVAISEAVSFFSSVNSDDFMSEFSSSREEDSGGSEEGEQVKPYSTRKICMYVH